MKQRKKKVYAGYRGPSAESRLGWWCAYLIPAIVLAAVLALPLWHEVKQWRSEGWLTESRGLKASGHKVPAFQKALSAYQWNPSDDDIVLNLARQSSGVGHPQALEWWSVVMDRMSLSDDDRLLVLKTAYSQGRDDIVDRYFPTFSKQLPQTKESWDLQLAVVERAGQPDLNLRLIEGLIDENPNEWMLRKKKIDLLTQVPGAYEERAWETLFAWIKRDDAIGLEALNLLLADDTRVLSDAERHAIMNRVKQHPLAVKQRTVLEAGEHFMRKKKSGSILVKRLESDWPEHNLILKREPVNWLLALGYFEAVEAYVSKQQALLDRVLFHALFRAKIELKKAQEAFDLSLSVEDAQVLSAPEKYVFRVVAMQAMGKPENEVRQTLDLAVDVATEADFRFLENEWLRQNDWPHLIRLYQRFLEGSDTLKRIGAGKLIHLYYFLGNESGVRKMLSEMPLDAYETLPALQSFLAYLHLVYEKDMDEATAVLEQLAARHPGSVPQRVLVAFAYRQLNHVEFAQALLKEIELEERMDFNRPIKIAYHSVLGSSSEFTKDTLLKREAMLLNH